MSGENDKVRCSQRFLDNIDGTEKTTLGLVLGALLITGATITTCIVFTAFSDHCTAVEAFENGYEQQIAPTPNGLWETLWVKSKHGEKAEQR